MTNRALLLVLAPCAVAACSNGAADRPTGHAAPAAPTTPPPATGAVPTDTTPYRIVEPTAGALWREGETHVIRWTSRRPGTVNLAAVTGGKDRGHLAFGLPAAVDSFVWRVPPGFITGFGTARSDAVRIRVEDAADPVTGVESAPFSITGAP